MGDAAISLNILLIDDDEVDRQSVIRSLKRGGTLCQVVQAATAADGLRLAAEQQFDAILLDYRLPDLDGIDVLRALRGDDFEGVAVVVLSRYEDETLAERCLEAGAQDFLLKDDVTGRRLSRTVRQARHRFQIEDALKRSREQLRQLSERDPLTKLHNRRGFELVLQASIARVQRGEGRLAVLLMDLDDFKGINDTLGHDAGDMLLVEIAQRLGAVVRDGDHLCRLGGDEFVVLMTDFERDEQAMLLADRIVGRLQAPISLGVTEQIITTSIGIATLGASTNDQADLLKFADLAMYQAKKDGGNQRRFYSAALQEAARLRTGIKHDLKNALERSEFKAFYQAQIDASDGRLAGVEALIRWQHPTRGLLTPEEFLSVAEETGQIIEIGKWVLREGCRQLKEWQLRLPGKSSDLTLAVNLSAVQLKQNTLPKTVNDALADCALSARSLELEITESAMILDEGASAETLSLIAEHGITLSLDDFGTGYSSLDYLKYFPISVLKIDRSFLSSVGCNKKNERLLKAIIAFAKTLDMKVVAEGVETHEQVEFCTHHKCDLLQGYYFSRPVPAAEFEMAFLMTDPI